MFVTTPDKNTLYFEERPNDKERILFINNRDSFVYNIVDYIRVLNPSAVISVVENSIEPNGVKQFSPDRIIISPGPGHPKYDTGNVCRIIREYAGSVPILGICLGHQAIAETFGDDPKIEYVGKARCGPMHGKVSKTFHNSEEIFEDVPNPLNTVRYHSLAVKGDLLPSVLEITAIADDGTIMALRHREYTVYGLQFHPESVLMIPYGYRILINFLKIKGGKRRGIKK